MKVPYMKGLSSNLLLSGALICGVNVSAAETSYSDHVAHVDDRVVVAGLIDLDTLRTAYPGEIMLVDLRTPAEGAAAEAAAAEVRGIGYANIPVASVVVDPDQVHQLRSVLAGAGPETLVVVHCVSGNRAGMLWGASELTDGRSVATVRASLESVLTKQPAIDGLEAYARSLDGGQ